MYKEIVDRLLAYPSQIKIDFDLKKKIFLFSVPIFSSRSGLPESVKSYTEARKNFIFKPHRTSYQIEKKTNVYLQQEIPFNFDFQATLRQNVAHFLQISKYCRRMLIEMALEEKFANALHLDTHFKE